MDTESVVGQVATGITRPWLEQKVQQLIEEDELDPEENLILYGLTHYELCSFLRTQSAGNQYQF